MSMNLLGILTGIAFGFLLQRGRVLRYEKQVGALLFRDMTILKFMLSAILVGMVGLQLLSAAELITLSHKPMNVGAVVLGGLAFGAGWAIMGFCPGTAIGALGEGRWHAAFAVLGMIAGAALFAESFSWLQETVLTWKDFGKISIADALGVGPWVVITAFSVLCLGLFAWFERKGL